jgi:phage FluMu protein gp41
MLATRPRSRITRTDVTAVGRQPQKMSPKTIADLLSSDVSGLQLSASIFKEISFSKEILVSKRKI